MSRARILVADDHDSLRRGIRLTLRETGHDVEEAANGNAAIGQLHSDQFDVVICDLKMEAATVSMCCAQPRRSNPRAP